MERFIIINYLNKFKLFLNIINFSFFMYSFKIVLLRKKSTKMKY